MSNATSAFMVSIETNQGGRNDNQDYAAEVDTPLGKLVIVCDGMGGTKGGALASEIATVAIINAFKTIQPGISPLTILRQAVEAANTAVYERSKANPSLRGMGTTATALLLGDQYQAYMAHVGDSRIYQINKGKLIFRTKDHSVVQEMVDKGQLSEVDARFHPDSNRITRALGVKERVEVEINHCTFKQNDIFILTSDGIHGELDEKSILKTVKQSRTIFEVSQHLIKDAFDNGMKSKNGKHDNLTIATVALNSVLKRMPSPINIPLVSVLVTAIIIVSVWLWLIPNPPIQETNIPHRENAYTMDQEITDEISNICNKIQNLKISTQLTINEINAIETNFKTTFVTTTEKYKSFYEISDNKCQFIPKKVKCDSITYNKNVKRIQELITSIKNIQPILNTPTKK